MGKCHEKSLEIRVQLRKHIAWCAYFKVNPCLHGDLCEFDDRLDIELTHLAGTMTFHGAFVDAKTDADLFVQQPAEHVGKNFFWNSYQILLPNLLPKLSNHINPLEDWPPWCRSRVSISPDSMVCLRRTASTEPRSLRHSGATSLKPWMTYKSEPRPNAAPR